MLIKTLMLTVLLWCVVPAQSAEVAAPRGAFANTCDVTGKVKESVKSFNFSKAFLNSDTITITNTTAWNGRMYCVWGIGADNMFYFSGLMGPKDNEPFYVEFSDKTSDTTYWLKFTVDFDPWKKVVSGTAGFHSIGSYQTTYTLTVTLLKSSPKDISGSNSKKTSNGVVTIIPAVVSGHGGADKGSSAMQYGNIARNYNIYDVVASNWDSGRFIAFERLTIVFSPNQTTCDAKDTTVQLPPATLARLISQGQAPGRFFKIPITCDSGTVLDTSTRRVTSWLASNDLLNEASSSTIMVNEESEAEGVGISLRDHMGQDIVLVNTSSSGSDATSLFTIEKGEKLDSDYNVYMEAYYKAYDTVKAGSVMATAMIMFNYE
ncbi:fimbrial protein [Aeromonas simiae]|uniref:fimbrial protein n=1 Tax=Aeromonas simiae TaxID=218936 RepID=UPI0006943F49|nr:fimbrial protein [Aeromonas simiae]